MIINFKQLSISLFAVSSLLFIGCNDVIKNSTTNPDPIGSAEYNSSEHTTDQITSPTTSPDEYVPIKSTTDSTAVCSNTTQNELIGSAQTLNDSIDLSNSLVQNSVDILKISESLMEAGPLIQTAYIRAMLSLSRDILTMSDNIGKMADKILVMSDDIGDMSDRIIETQKIQSANAITTELNILAAQNNFNKLLE